MRRAGLAVLFVVGFAVAGGFSTVVLADTNPAPTSSSPTTTAQDTTTPDGGTTTIAAPARAPRVLPADVTIGGVPVGGMRPADAYLALQAWASEPLHVVVGKTRLAPTREQLGATRYLEGAIRRARASVAGAAVKVVVSVRGADVRRYVDGLAKRYDRAAVDAKLRFRKTAPVLTRDRAGLRIRKVAATAALVKALKANETEPVVLPVQELKPKVTRKGFGPIVVIRRGSNHLLLYRGQKLWRQFTVATGQSVYPTPLGRFQIVSMWKNPWWYPPASPWAAGEKPVPPGPGNPLGTRWMGISSPGVGIHGTPDAASLGYSASHGCIRMAIPQAEWLFDHVEVGTPVYIVSA
ncbi:MAG TPA: L,D-transpeptidase family protein [Gaiellaceae bacterium]|nr:L,D-transpeptidase family protein [Gaiellaceae bacterium]